MGYKHLTREQRYAAIEALLQTPMSLQELGDIIGVSKGTVSREFRRNSDMRGYHRYRWHLAQKKYERRMKGEEMVCAETIYRWIWQEKRRGNDEMARNLRHGGRRRPRRDSQYSSRGMIHDRVDISLRPDVVDEKKRFGDFEMDTIIGKNRKGAILTTNDRCTHLVLIRQYIPKGTDFSELTDEMIAEIEWKLNNRPRKSLGYLTPIEYCRKMFNFELGVRCTSK